MKKTFTINLGGIIFHIDDDAYQLLNQYLESLKRHFSVMEDSREILDDIEARIAEILQEGLSENRQVITVDDINKVMRMMGKPEEIGDKKEEAGTEGPEPGIKGIKRLYRDPDEKILGGVCSGIAAYFHIDPVWVRLAFIIFLIAGGAGILLYLVLWFVIPEAVTTTEQLQMRGEQVTIANIEKSVGEELRELKERIGKMANGTQDTLRKTGSVTRTAFESVMTALLSVLKVIFRILVVLTGFVMTVTGIAMAVIFGIFLFGLGGDFITNNGISSFAFPELAHILFGHDITYFFVLITLILLLGIPVLMLIYGGLKMIFRFPGIRYLGLTTFNLWILGLILGGFFAFRIANLYKEYAEIKQPLQFEKPSADTLFITLNEQALTMKYMDDPLYTMFGDAFVVHPSKNEIYLMPGLNFTPADDSLFKANRIDYSRGKTTRDARTRLSQISFSSSFSGDTLLVDPYAKLADGEPWRGQTVHIRISVPEGKYVHIDHRLRNNVGGGFFLKSGEKDKTYQMKDGWMQEAESEEAK